MDNEAFLLFSFFNFLATSHGMWDLGSLTRGRTRALSKFSASRVYPTQIRSHPQLRLQQPQLQSEVLTFSELEAVMEISQCL